VRFEQALRELESRQPERMVPDLSRITALADLLDNPQLTYPTIHVTGTNGKTTTARFLTSIACAHGLATGAYTSPHLDSVTERLSLCGEPIPGTEFGAEYERLLPYLGQVDAAGERVTYFEALTALAFLWFADKPVELGVFEVGMGGVWDATNLVAGDVAVLCEVGLDHPELGSTIADVAAEKAGIVKEGKVAVSRAQPEEALEVIRRRCKEVDARLLLEGEDFGLAVRSPSVGGQLVDVRGLHGTYADVQLQLFGEHAARNAAASVAAMEALLDRPLSEEALRQAMSETTSPGRLEVVGRHPLVVLDGAHNPAAARALVEGLAEAFVWDRLLVVLGCSSNKDIPGIVSELRTLPAIERVFATRHSTPRAAAPEDVARAALEAGLATDTSPDVRQALEAARGLARETDLILVTGSLYTVADARRAILPTRDTRRGQAPPYGE
jgi:dihydrofolate synthase/folylpolyglutamate synthase